jgi:hypothetical protein
MNAVEIEEKLRSEPFTPLRLYLTDGRKVDIESPDIVVISRSGLNIFRIKRGASHIADETMLISLNHIVSIEELHLAENH